MYLLEFSVDYIIYRDSPGVLIVLISSFDFISRSRGCRMSLEWDSRVETRLFLVFNVFNDLSYGIQRGCHRWGGRECTDLLIQSVPPHPDRPTQAGGVQWTIAHTPWISPGKSRERQPGLFVALNRDTALFNGGMSTVFRGQTRVSFFFFRARPIRQPFVLLFGSRARAIQAGRGHGS